LALQIDWLQFGHVFLELIVREEKIKVGVYSTRRRERMKILEVVAFLYQNLSL
jgi:hypothetical protein